MNITINGMITLNASPSGWVIAAPLGRFSSNWRFGVPSYVGIDTSEERIFAAKFALAEYAVRMKALIPILDNLLEHPEQIEITLR